MTTIKIGITGPESTGKSSLAKVLSQHYHSTYVPEMARSYLEQLGRRYDYSDLKKIAEWQCEAEDKAIANNPEFLVCDTTLLVIKIWSEFNFHQCDEWILAEEKRRPYDLFLLTDIDLPWEKDPLREHPEHRKELFSLYYRTLIQCNRPFRIVFGTGEERTNRAIGIISSFLDQRKNK